MQDVNTLVELVSGYEAYADADELATSAATDAPATTAACLWWTVGFTIGGGTVSIVRGC